jgi:hypothetical protein
MLAFETTGQVRDCKVTLGQQTLPAKISQRGTRVEVSLRSPVVLKSGEHLDVKLASVVSG